MKKYTYKTPLFYTGDYVEFWLHNRKGISRGVINHVTTSYGYHNNQAYHIYSIVREGKERHLHIAEENIRYVVRNICQNKSLKSKI